MMDKILSVIIPAYNEEKLIELSYNTISKILNDEDILYEIVYVNDGSKDNTWNNIKQLSDEHDDAKGICFSRNFGKEAAIFAGLNECSGDCCVVVDCDLQHPPQKIVEMYRLWESGYEIVEGVKSDRGTESVLHGLASRTFYGLISKATGVDMSSTSDFKLLDRKAIEVIKIIKEKHAFFRALSFWVGFKSTQITYEVQERTEGESKWSTWGLVKYAVSNITSFTTAPMQIVTVLGIISFIVSIVFGITAICQKISGIALGGFTTVILLLLFMGSIIMISLGIIGYYIARIYEEIQGRPRYVVSEVIK